jgi:hypothetical protein
MNVGPITIEHAITKKAKEIGDRPAFPHEYGKGMTYKQWLYGQYVSGQGSFSYAKEYIKMILKELAEEELKNDANR